MIHLLSHVTCLWYPVLHVLLLYFGTGLFKLYWALLSTKFFISINNIRLRHLQYIKPGLHNFWGSEENCTNETNNDFITGNGRLLKAYLLIMWLYFWSSSKVNIRRCDVFGHVHRVWSSSLGHLDSAEWIILLFSSDIYYKLK